MHTFNGPWWNLTTQLEQKEERRVPACRSDSSEPPLWRRSVAAADTHACVFIG